MSDERGSIPISVACGVTWPYKRKPCTAWGAPSAHGCKYEPGGHLLHRCLCGSRYDEAEGMTDAEIESALRAVWEAAGEP